VAGQTSDIKSQIRPGSDREHYFWIDALRGCAALIVVISHVSIFGLYGYEHTLATLPPTRLLWAGHQAVILFFVISGFALFLLFESMAKAGCGWPKFILVRFLRLYPPYLASLLLALLVLNAPRLFGVLPPANMPIIANGHVTAATLVGHLFMIGIFDVEAINPPIWTLVYEARLCLLFPLIYLVVARGTWSRVGMVAAAWLVVVCSIAAWEYHYVPNLAFPMLRTADLALTFLIGATAAKFRVRIGEWISTRRPSVVAALLVLSVIVFMYSYGYSWPGWTPKWVQLISEIFPALASAYFVVLAIAFPAPSKHRVLGFLGRISYSLYLVHQIAIMGVALLFFGRYSAPVLWIISIAASLGIAWLFYLAIEAPAIAASRNVRSRQMHTSGDPIDMAHPFKD
jgi:peptidoglycan/LPS O-acetylase OafA/YrhL